MKILNFTALLFMATLVSGCAGPPPEPPPGPSKDLSAPDPILSTDQVADARAAIHLGVARCFPRLPEVSFQAELQKDQWFVWADLKSGSFSADVAKSDGTVTNCRDIEI